MCFDGKVMTENAAILAFLDRQYSDVKLLPKIDDSVLANIGLSDLAWCSGAIYLIVRQICNPGRLTRGDRKGVQKDGLEKLSKETEDFSNHLSGGRWWYGDSWSILDVCIYWAYSTAEKGGFALLDYPDLIEHAARVRARSSFQRTLKRELDSADGAGIEFKGTMAL